MGCSGSRPAPVPQDTSLLSGTALFRARPLPVAWSQVKVTGYPMHRKPRSRPASPPKEEEQPVLFGVPDGAGEERDADSTADVTDDGEDKPETFDDLPTLVPEERWPMPDAVSHEALPPPTPYLRGLDLDDDISLDVPDETLRRDDRDIYSPDEELRVLAETDT